MRVLHVCGRMHPGGITRFVESIAGLNDSFDSRHDILLTFSSGPDPRPGPYAVHRLDFGRLGMLAAARAARRLFREYDAVMLHGAHPVVVWPLAGRSRRVLMFQHGMAVSTGARWVLALKKLWFSMVPRLLDATIVCSTEFALQKSRALGISLPASRVRIVPFGTSLRPGGRARTARDVITVGLAGRLHAQKRQDLVLRSFDRYDGPRRFRVLIAGEGPERARLEALARNAGERVDIVFLGNVDDMEAFYDDLDLLAFPSEGESFGLVALEALMRGVPVAVFPDVGGCLPLIREGESGFVVQGGVEGLRALWQTLDAAPERLPAMSARIRSIDYTRFGAAGTRAALDALAAAS